MADLKDILRDIQPQKPKPEVWSPPSPEEVARADSEIIARAAHSQDFFDKNTEAVHAAHRRERQRASEAVEAAAEAHRKEILDKKIARLDREAAAQAKQDADREAAAQETQRKIVNRAWGVEDDPA